jgi:hypothetical protein
MLEYLYLARWDQTFLFLQSGSPPIYVRLLALNAVFLALYAVRKAAVGVAMSPGMSLFAQLFALGANLLILFQREVEVYFGFRFPF